MSYCKIVDGYFTASNPVANKFIALPFLPDSFEWWNLTQYGTTTANKVISGIAFSNSSSPTGFVTISNGSASQGEVLDPNTGISFISAGTYQYGTTFTISSFTAGTMTIVTSANNNYQVGDVVLVYGMTGDNQINGLPFTVTTVNSATSFVVNGGTNSFGASNASNGFVKKVLYPDLYIPYIDYITSVTPNSDGTSDIGLTMPPAFVVGQEVAFKIPSQFGMVQLDSDVYLQSHFQPQQAYVTAVNVANRTITVNVNTSSFTAFAYPTSSVAGMGTSFPQVIAIGDQNTGYTFSNAQVPYLGVNNGVIGIPGAFAANTRQGVYFPAASTYASGTAATNFVASDVIRWRAIFPDMLITS